MSKSHGGFSIEELKEVGIKPNQRDIARSLAGNESAAQVTAQAPESEAKPGEVAEKKTRRSRMSSVDPEVEKAKENILRLRCQRFASLPYSLMSAIFGDEAIKLSHEEESMLTESYVTLAKAYGWEATSKLILWGDVMICHAVITFKPERKEAILAKLGMIGEPQKEEVQENDSRSN